MRAAPLVVFLAFIAFGLAWLSSDPALRRRGYVPGCSLSTAPEGTSLARSYLSARGVSVETLTRPLSVASLPANAVLFRIAAPASRDSYVSVNIPETEPEEGAKPDESKARDANGPDGGVATASTIGTAEAGVGRFLTEAEEAFATAGGRLVLLQRGDRAEGPLRKVLPLLPGVRSLDPADASVLPKAALIDVQPVFGRDTAPTIARRVIGKGEAWLLSDPEIFYNARLGNADHLKLLVALAGPDRPVFFDEQIHGLREEGGVLGLLRQWGFGPALLFAALALLAVYWRGAVTIGPTADVWRDLRGDSVDLVDAMAALYRRALSPAQALHLYRARFVYEIALRRSVSDQRAEALLPELAPGLNLPPAEERISESEFRRHLNTLVRSLERLRHEHRRSSS